MITRLQATPRHSSARHNLLETIARCCAGAESRFDMALFAEATGPVLRQFQELEHVVPSRDTFSQLFRLLEPAASAGSLRPLPKATRGWS